MTSMASVLPTATPVRNDTRNDPAPPRSAATCLLCAAPRLSGRGRYCSAACRQRAFRLRHTALPSLEESLLRKALRRRATLTEHTVYECPVCETRLLGEQRCPCEQPVLLSELLDLELDLEVERM